MDQLVSVQNVVKKLQIMIMTSSQSRLHLITQEDLNVLVGKFTQGQKWASFYNLGYNSEIAWSAKIA